MKVMQGMVSLVFLGLAEVKMAFLYQTSHFKDLYTTDHRVAATSTYVTQSKSQKLD